MTRRCPHCHNEIPDWTNGVCNVCARGERDAKRSGTKYKPASMKYSTIKRDVKSNRQTIAPILNHPLEKKTKKKKYPKSSTRKITKQKKRSIPLKPISSAEIRDHGRKHDIKLSLTEPTRRQINNINEFFIDAYGRDQYFSYALRKHWILDDQIQSIKYHQLKIKTFLRYVLASLRDRISKEFNPEGYSILNLMYGLNGDKPLTPEDIAIKLRISIQTVYFMKKVIIDYLNSQTGSKIMDEIIFEAYRKTQRRNI